MSTQTTDFSQLLALLRSLEAAAASDLSGSLAKITAAFGTLPPHLQASIQALKKAGAWSDKPLAPNTAKSPYYIVPPCAIEVENMPPPLLQAELASQSQQVPAPADAYGNAEVTLYPLVQN